MGHNTLAVVDMDKKTFRPAPPPRNQLRFSSRATFASTRFRVTGPALRNRWQQPGRMFQHENKKPLAQSVPKRFTRTLKDGKTTIECNPEATAEADAAVADVGVLACSSTGTGSGAGEICVANAMSSLGGFCYPVAGYTRVCDPTSSYFNTDCDCSAFSNDTQTGSIRCLTSTQNAGSIFYGCSTVRALDFDMNSFQKGRYSTRGTCREFVSLYGGEGNASTPRSSNQLCIELHSTFGDPFAFNTSSCDMQMNGQSCTSCTLTMDFPAWPKPSASTWTADCSNLVEGLTVSDYTEFPIVQACSKPVLDGTVCDLCGGADDGTRIFYTDNTLISLDGFRGGTDFTCGALLSANNALQISSDKCSEAAAVAQATCCVYQWYVVVVFKGQILVRGTPRRITRLTLIYHIMIVLSLCVFKSDICFGRGLANTTAYVPMNVTGFGETTCHDVRNAGTVNHSIPADICQSLRDDIGEICCRRQWGSSEPAPAPSNSPAMTSTGLFSLVMASSFILWSMSASFLWWAAMN